MRKNFGTQPWTFPQPVFIIGTYDGDGKPNAMSAVWGGISDANEIMLCLSAEHKTVKNLLQTKAFSVSFATADKIVECDYLGVESGNTVADKIIKSGFTVVKSEFVNAPLFEQLPVALECSMTAYDTAMGLLKGKIENISADERVLSNGKIDLQKFRPVSFDPVSHCYNVIGEKVGMAFKDGMALR